MTFVGNAQIIRGDGTKACSGCGAIKALDEFSIAAKEKSGHKSACKACIKLDAAEYYRRNKARIDARNKAYATANPTVILAASTRYRLRNPEKHLARVLAWQARNPDAKILIKANWYARNAAKTKASTAEWFAANPDARRRYDAKRRERIQLAGGCFTEADRRELFEQQRGCCAGCGCELGPAAHADHIVPLVCAGSNEISNRQLLCSTCNSRKNIKPMEQFLRLMRASAF